LETLRERTRCSGRSPSGEFAFKQINGVEVDLSTTVVVGQYLGSQMAAFDFHAPVGLIEQVQDGVHPTMRSLPMCKTNDHCENSTLRSAANTLLG